LELEKWKLAFSSNALDLIFPNESGEPMNYSNMVQRHFLSALKKAKIPVIRFHDLWHTYASLLIEQGENLKYIETQLGHSSPTGDLERVRPPHEIHKSGSRRQARESCLPRRLIFATVKIKCHLGSHNWFSASIHDSYVFVIGCCCVGSKPEGARRSPRNTVLLRCIWLIGMVSMQGPCGELADY
jgi:hypothetical protein